MITREKIGGLIGTVIFAILLFLILLFSVFTLSFPPEELEGIPVMFGTTEDAFGIAEPPITEVTPTPTPSPEVPPYSPTEPLITQTTEPTIDVEAEREEERRKEQLAAERRAREEAERRKKEEEARKREINRQMSGLFGEGSGSRGNTEGEGTQGVSTGNATQGSPTGTGGIGSYDLGGRSLGSGGLGQPNYTVNDYGTVVVNITVDPAGNVIHAEIGRGTNTPSATLREEALRAARRTKFNAINSANNQQGTITYRFNLK
ncbi:energy transducer TonB [Proteiniphilum sp. X52]|uniref:energy transducer TonB family protein n=1 Tax=Proteiniphilum sp. X52 TaxID=2382159 RepID=UPI000F0A6324|nr:energy transducer TonB [Proteiniphilum sp. X52]RNC65017.1 energy transducer TonB [Proteiniphilum sp. X52]